MYPPTHDIGLDLAELNSAGPPKDDQTEAKSEPEAAGSMVALAIFETVSTLLAAGTGGAGTCGSVGYEGAAATAAPLGAGRVGITTGIAGPVPLGKHLRLRPAGTVRAGVVSGALVVVGDSGIGVVVGTGTTLLRCPPSGTVDAEPV